MRDCLRNQVEFWYSLFVRKDPVLKDGMETGQYVPVYSDPVKANARITSATGDTDSELFGASVQYDRVISTVQDLPIDEFSRIWIDKSPERYDDHDYVVKRVAKGLNQNLWAIAKVTR